MSEPDWPKIIAEADEMLAHARRQRDQFRQALEPFAALGRTKGGTPQAEELKTLIVHMMECSKPGDGLAIIHQFTTACLKAREAFEHPVK